MTLVPRLQQVGRSLEQQFIGKDEVIRLLLISVVAGEHALLIGPPGTAKSALVRSLARLVHARYFEYLLTRFTEPNELFGPIDIVAFREGVYQRRLEGMLPEAEIVFLDEVFKSNSAILNSLLTLLNERVFAVGNQVLACPLVSVIGASNEVPTDETLNAIFDRFLLRIRNEQLDAFHFHDLLLRGVADEVRRGRGEQTTVQPLVSAQELAHASRMMAQGATFSEAFLARYKALVFQIRAEGIALSDRRVVKLLKLFAASAFLDGRAAPDDGDFFLLRHIWNHADQAPLLDQIVQPVLEGHFREHPERRRVGSVGMGIEALSAEIERIRQVLTEGSTLGDVQLFSQLKALGEIKAALAGLVDPRARELERRVHDLLTASFQSGRFATL
jgi:MoxR-like ATPase